MPTSRTFLITGASKGIGRATAEALVRRGQTVIGVARRPPEDEFPGEFHAVDLGDRAATATFLADVTSRHEVLGLLNNVGLVSPRPLGEITPEEFDAVIDLNLRCALQCTQAVLPAMRRASWGRIVSTSSLVTVGVKDRTSYAAAKCGLISFTRTWALELAEEGITVNCVAPGVIETDLFNTNNPPGSESRERYIGMIPMRRSGRPEEIAAANLYFFSEEAAFTTGQTMYVDGGASTGHASF